MTSTATQFRIKNCLWILDLKYRTLNCCYSNEKCYKSGGGMTFYDCDNDDDDDEYLLCNYSCQHYQNNHRNHHHHISLMPLSALNVNLLDEDGFAILPLTSPPPPSHSQQQASIIEASEAFNHHQQQQPNNNQISSLNQINNQIIMIDDQPINMIYHLQESSSSSSRNNLIFRSILSQMQPPPLVDITSTITTTNVTTSTLSSSLPSLKREVERQFICPQSQSSTLQVLPRPRYATQIVYTTNNRTHFLFGGNQNRFFTRRCDDLWICQVSIYLRSL